LNDLYDSIVLGRCIGQDRGWEDIDHMATQFLNWQPCKDVRERLKLEDKVYTAICLNCGDGTFEVYDEEEVVAKGDILELLQGLPKHA
jgi:hypothetical protein